MVDSSIVDKGKGTCKVSHTDGIIKTGADPEILEGGAQSAIRYTSMIAAKAVSEWRLIQSKINYACNNAHIF